MGVDKQIQELVQLAEMLESCWWDLFHVAAGGLGQELPRHWRPGRWSDEDRVMLSDSDLYRGVVCVPSEGDSRWQRSLVSDAFRRIVDGRRKKNGWCYETVMPEGFRRAVERWHSIRVDLLGAEADGLDLWWLVDAVDDEMRRILTPENIDRWHRDLVEIVGAQPQEEIPEFDPVIPEPEKLDADRLLIVATVGRYEHIEQMGKKITKGPDDRWPPDATWRGTGRGMCRHFLETRDGQPMTTTVDSSGSYRDGNQRLVETLWWRATADGAKISQLGISEDFSKFMDWHGGQRMPLHDPEDPIRVQVVDVFVLTDKDGKLYQSLRSLEAGAKRAFYGHHTRQQDRRW